LSTIAPQNLSITQRQMRSAPVQLAVLPPPTADVTRPLPGSSGTIVWKSAAEKIRNWRMVKLRVAQAIRRGVEPWQVNFAMDQTGVRVQSYHRLDPQLIGQPSVAD
jgi:hypothetical protein